MRVFISWSGDQSKQVAEYLREWLPQVIQCLDPWVSADDIESGSRWLRVLDSELEQGFVGIACITQDNQLSPWIQFEVGVLSKAADQSRVTPYLLDLAPADLEDSPLTMFQARRANEDDTWKLVQDLNRLAGDRRVKSETSLRKAFDHNWPDLELRITASASTIEAPAKRQVPDMVAEILDHVRALRRQGATSNEEIPNPRYQLYVSIPQVEKVDADSALVHKVYEILDSFTGQDLATILLWTPSGPLELESPRMTTRYCVNLVRQLEAVLGVGCVEAIEA